MKKCSKCSIEKPLTDYYKHKTNKDGLHCWCKSCVNESTKKYFKTDKGKKELKKSVKKWATKTSGVYEWYEDNICLYIGQSSRLNSRINLHKSLFRNPHTSKKQNSAELYEALRQHKNPQIRIIEECSSKVFEGFCVVVMLHKVQLNFVFLMCED